MDLLDEVLEHITKRMARHSDASLTEEIYTDFDLLGDEEREAAAALGELRRRVRGWAGDYATTVLPQAAATR